MTNLVFASYFTGTKDPQRNTTWASTPKNLIPLIESVVDHKLVIFHDCFDEVPDFEHCSWVKANDDLTGVYSASVLRWFRYLRYLNELEQKPEKLFMVDSTDVIMLSNPFDQMVSDTLYCGDENKTTTGCGWLRRKASKFTAPDFYQVTQSHKHERLLNAGLVGGYIDICLEFLSLLTNYHLQYNTVTDASESMDMPGFNYTVWKHFASRLIHGHPVNTGFKDNQFDYTKWWKHK